MLTFGSQPLRTLYLGELRMLMRDRRTIIASIVLPILFLPVVFWLTNKTEKGREKRIETQTFHYAVVGPLADEARELLARSAALHEVEDDKAADKAADEAADKASTIQLEEAEVANFEDAEQKLEARKLHAVIVARSAQEARAENAAEADADATEGEAEKSADGGSGKAVRDETDLAVPNYRIVFQGDWDYSETAAGALSSRLYEARRQVRAELLKEAGFPVDPDDVAPIAESRDLATAGQRGGRALGRFAVSFLLLFLLTGGSIVAADTLAGEKERGTLETLLTSAASRTEIVFAKLLVIITVGLVISVIQVANLLVYVGLKLIELPQNMSVEVSPLSAAWILLLMVPLSVLVAAALLLSSGRAKSYKEFQVAFFPVFVLLLAPTLASMLPAIELRSAIVLVPIANVAVAVRELLIGKIDWPFLSLALLVTSVAAWQLVRWTHQALQTERLVTGAELDEADFQGGPGLFRRHVPIWFGVIWVLIFLGGNVSWLQSMERQVLLNVVFLMGCGSIFMARRYDLKLNEVFAFRRPSPWVWPAVLLGAPSFLLTSTAVIKLSNFLFPVPEKLLESFSKVLMPEEMPMWKLLLIVAVVPGIFEELAFRGALLHGLRKRFTPWQLALVTGAIFGLFHMSLFRILPTATLGVVLATVTLLTGSIFPAMLWHATSNASAILLGQQGLDIADLDPMVYAAAGAVSIMVFTLLWRTRRVYPDLKGAALRESRRAVSEVSSS